MGIAIAPKAYRCVAIGWSLSGQSDTAKHAVHSMASFAKAKRFSFWLEKRVGKIWKRVSKHNHKGQKVTGGK